MANLTRYELKISKLVGGLSSVDNIIILNSGKNTKIEVFSGFCPSSIDFTIQLIWKYNTDSPEILWQFTGSGEMPFIQNINSIDVNGKDGLAIKCINDSANSVNMSAYALIFEFD